MHVDVQHPQLMNTHEYWTIMYMYNVTSSVKVNFSEVHSAKACLRLGVVLTLKVYSLHVGMQIMPMTMSRQHLLPDDTHYLVDSYQCIL